MDRIEQKIIALFSPLPFSLKAKIVAALSQVLAKEAMQGEEASLQADLETSNKVRSMVEADEMDLLSEEEGKLLITDQLKKRIAAIEERHASGEGKTYPKEEFRKQLDNLLAK